MIPVGKSPVRLRDGNNPLTLHSAAQGVPQGGIYVAMTENNTLRPQLTDGDRVVLESEADTNQKAELITRGGNGPIDSGTVMQPGIYLNGVNYAKFSNRTDLTLRLYTERDTLRKIASVTGLVLLLPAAGALIAAVVGIFFLWSSQGQPSTATAAGTAQTVLAWAGQPADQLEAPDVGGAHVAQVHQQLDTRSRDAEWCLLAIEGQQAPAVTIPGVTCAPARVPWWRSTLTGSLITGGVAVLTALTGIVALRSHYGFQKSPAS
jgi:hypothetical protein